MRTLARNGIAAACLSLLGFLAFGVSAALALPPTATIEDASAIGPTTADVAGAVDPQGSSTFWRFDYISDPAYQHNLSQALPPFHGADTGPQGKLGASETVAGQLTGLQPGLTYHLRLFAENADGSAEALAANFTTEATPPTVTPPANSPLGQEEVGLGAYVTPNGDAITDCHFEYGLTEAYGQSAPCASSDEVQSISVTATGGTYRLSFEGETTADIPYNAKADVIAARLRALSSIGSPNLLLDGNNTFTFVRALAGSDVPELLAEDGAEPLTGGGVSITTLTEGGTPATAVLSTRLNTSGLVHATLSGLTPGATYHVRLIATNSEGTTPSEGGIFTVLDVPGEPSCPNEGALGTSFLPDCRAWEMVSPPQKNGADVIASTLRTTTSLDGSALQFSSLAAFGDARGTGIATEYIARRSPDSSPAGPGWSTHAITPPQDSHSLNETVAQESHYEQLSSSLDSGVFFSFTPLTDDPGVANVVNFYRRNNLLTPGLGTDELISACPLCASTATALPPLPLRPGEIAELDPPLAGATPDLSTAVFESRYNLTVDAPAQPEGCDYGGPQSKIASCWGRLYEWEKGTLRLAGVLPGGPAADVSIAGRGSGGTHPAILNPHVVSDGSDGHTRVFFTQPTDATGHTSSELTGNAAQAVSESDSGNLFMRLDGTSTVQLNLSERAANDSSFSPATYEDASLDGQRVFFSSGQALTDDAPLAGTKLYVYDASQPPGSMHNLTLVTQSLGSIRIIGTSSDGTYVYFVRNADRIFLWHAGETRGIAPLSAGEADLLDSGSSWALTLRQARITPDGRFLLFTAYGGEGVLAPYGAYDYSHGGCIGGLALGCRVLYLFDAQNNSLRCVSCNSSGVAVTSFGRENQAGVSFEGAPGGSRRRNHDNRAISDDGHYVFFSTGEPLLEEDTDGAFDAYRLDVASGELRLLSSGTDSHGSWFLDSTPDGSNAFIGTSGSLSGWDEGDSLDVYDARVGGGFPEPRPVPAPCASAETCHLATGGAPPPSPLGSGQQGPGNRPARQACPKGKRLVKVKGGKRCLKPGRHRRHASKNRRAGR